MSEPLAYTPIQQQRIEWIANGLEENPTARLYGKLHIGLSDFHVIAIAVHEENNSQVTDDPFWQTELGEYHNAAGADGHFETETILGRKYALFITPFCK